MMIVHMNDEYEKKAVREMVRMHLTRIRPMWKQAKKGEIANLDEESYKLLDASVRVCKRFLCHFEADDD